MNDRQKFMMMWPVAGFLVVVAFGVGLLSMAAIESSPRTVAAGDQSHVIDVELGELFIKPATIEAEPGPLTLRVHNGGQVGHNFTLTDLASTDLIPPGETKELSVPSLEAGTYDFFCNVPGHPEGGMKGQIVVGGAAGTAAAPAGHAGMSAQEMMEADVAATSRFPAKTEGVGGKQLRPQIAADGAKVFTLTADEIEWEVEPGKFVAGLAYNGQIPGPQINVDLGDRVRIKLTNNMDVPTTIHHHGLTVPAAMDGVPVISQDAVMPGGKFTYEFVVRNTGSHMYHSHFMANEQVPMGLLGAFIVHDPADPKVDHDTTMILNDGPLGFTLNGKGFPATTPLAVEKGDLIRIRYMNEGLQMHPMHLHGIDQEVIAVDGKLLDDPYLQDTVMVAPGSRIDVLVRATESGTWAWHCHILSHAESATGMFGMVTAMIVR